MKITHLMRWQCLAASHEPLEYDTPEEFEQHMRADHEGTYPADELPFITEISQYPTLPVIDHCPFCPDIELEDAELEAHVCQHLQKIALQSLDPPYSEFSGSSDDDGSRPPTRSTILELRYESPEPLMFYDDGLDSTVDPGVGAITGIRWSGLRLSI